MSRDLNNEYQDKDDRKYAYDFDYILRDYMIETFRPFFRGGKVLEMGCYVGEFTKILLGLYDDVTVLEGSSELITKANENVGGRARFIHGQFETTELSERYDAIFLMHTLEHLNDPITVLKKINGWLSETGRLFLVVPNANAPSRQIAVKMGLISHNSAVTEGEYTHGHRRTYALDTLERDARLGGLSVIHRGGIFFKPFANYQFDKLLKTDVISKGYLDGCYQLGMLYPDLCASVYLICGKGEAGGS
jgi:2-polyprenyl-3-methyl-5-hydroxy-6-metoxy-1,4-benzoquinol methylase